MGTYVDRLHDFCSLSFLFSLLRLGYLSFRILSSHGIWFAQALGGGGSDPLRPAARHMQRKPTTYLLPLRCKVEAGLTIEPDHASYARKKSCMLHISHTLALDSSGGDDSGVHGTTTRSPNAPPQRPPLRLRGGGAFFPMFYPIQQNQGDRGGFLLFPSLRPFPNPKAPETANCRTQSHDSLVGVGRRLV